MPVARIDLDGKGAGSPEGLVTLILKNEPQLAPPTPVEALCRQLDILDIREHSTDSFEGMLLTDADKHSGIIVVKEGVGKGRRRFTISHELGHFLIPSHKPPTKDGFQCTRADMLLQHAKSRDRRAQMEVEANRFSALLLMPPPLLRAEFRKRPKPDIAHMVKLAADYEVSKEAMARAYADHHPDLVAVVISQHGKIVRSYRNQMKFPFIQPKRGQDVPRGSSYYKGPHSQGTVSDFRECLADVWIEVQRGERAPTLYEQIYSQQNGFALIMLHLEKRDEEEEAEDRDLERSWEARFRK
jgi:Zn-dependent peptidase ImmA (M78 family)